MLDVIALAEQDTQLHRASYKEQAGPCPAADCRCQTDGFRVKWNGGKWAFMCRGCWDSEEFLSDRGRKRGWGDEIDYLRHYRGMTFKQAQAFLAEQGNDVPSTPGPDYLPTDSTQGRPDIVKEYVECLWSPDDTLALDYARSRGLSDEVIRKAQLGYSTRGDIPRLIIPSFSFELGRFTAIYRRDLRPDVPKGERWMLAPGSTNSELYLAESLQMKRPTVLCEDALSALSVVQECADLVNVVATGGADCCKRVKWLARLSRMPLVLVALDADRDGDEHAKWWLARLPNARRLRPFLKDINDMLMQGWDVRDWIQELLAESEQVESERIASSEPAPDIDAGPQPFTSLEQFVSVVDELALGVFGPGCTITLVPKGYTLAQHVERLNEEARDRDRAMWALAREKYARRQNND